MKYCGLNKKLRITKCGNSLFYEDYIMNSFVKNLEEIMEKVKNEFNKEKKQREDFEENVFNLIEETCTKLATSNLDN